MCNRFYLFRHFFQSFGKTIWFFFDEHDHVLNWDWCHWIHWNLKTFEMTLWNGQCWKTSNIPFKRNSKKKKLLKCQLNCCDCLYLGRVKAIFVADSQFGNGWKIHTFSMSFTKLCNPLSYWLSYHTNIHKSSGENYPAILVKLGEYPFFIIAIPPQGQSLEQWNKFYLWYILGTNKRTNERFEHLNALFAFTKSRNCVATLNRHLLSFKIKYWYFVTISSGATNTCTTKCLNWECSEAKMEAEWMCYYSVASLSLYVKYTQFSLRTNCM